MAAASCPLAGVLSPQEASATSCVSEVADSVFLDNDDNNNPDTDNSTGWELSKENVLPLRAGRRLKSLNDAVARDSHSTNSALREERHTFEAELRRQSTSGTAQNSDSVFSPHHALLDIWHRYVCWTEQNYLSGKELEETLQRALQAFPQANGAMAQVAEEPAYVDLWLKYAGFKDEPGDVYQFMYSKRIGVKNCLLYEQWAWLLEDLGNTKKASAVLQKGIEKEATPLGRLARLKADLEMRVLKALKAGSDEGSLDEDVENRKTLGDLKGRGKNVVKAPIARVGPQATIPGRRGISDSNAANTNQRTSSSVLKKSTSSNVMKTPTSGSGFAIFADGVKPYEDSVSDNNYNANPVSASKKENVPKAASWNKVRAKQKASSIPTTPLTPSFDIHVDDSAFDDEAVFKTPAKTPAKTINMTHVKPLSTKKLPKEPCKPLDFLEDKGDGKEEEKFMFCKDRLYQGLEEFSFEEIRFEKWKANKNC